MKRALKILYFFAAITVYSSCYKPNNPPRPYTTPTFSIFARELYYYYDNEGSIQDSIVIFNVNANDSLTLYLTFDLISGNPENYPITCFIDGFANGITASDSETFKLNYFTPFTIYANKDTGVYPFYINVRTPAYGLKSYPALLHIHTK